jgi:hypothetical protein
LQLSLALIFGNRVNPLTDGGAKMTGLVRKAALLGACGLTAASVSLAGLPDGTNSKLFVTGGAQTTSLPVCVTGPNDVAPDPGGPTRSPFTGVTSSCPGPTSRTVVVQDFSGAAVIGALVKVSFSECCDIQLCNVAGSQAGVTHDIATHTVSGFTQGPDGSFTFIVVGTGNNMEDGSPPTQEGCGVLAAGHNARLVRITADVGSGDVPIEDAQAYVYNMDGTGIGAPGGTANTVSANDAFRNLGDANAANLGGQKKGRSDFGRSALPFTPDTNIEAYDAFINLTEGNYLTLGNQSILRCPGGLLGVHVCP